MKFTVDSVTSPKYANESGDTIECLVKFSYLPEPIWFGATSYDVEPHGVQIYQDCVAGKYGLVAAYEPPASIPVVEIAA
jgi:hypothetical protein